MLFRRRVAHGTGNQSMVRYRFGPLDLRMAGSTGTGSLGRGRIMGIMTGYAWFSWVVRIRVNLRESGGP